jgi:Cu(I)/Ag(I) efflux system membrane fusion protein
VREGSAFAPGAPLFRLNDLRKVWVNARVPESQLALLSVGSEVSVRATAFPEKSFSGRVTARLPEIDVQTRTATARISVENPEENLAPGMFVSIDVSAGSTQPQLVVPTEAIITTGERSVVIVAKEAGAFDVVDVTTGIEVEGKTAILSGLEGDESVVLSGQFLIDSEASLRSSVSRLSAEPEQQQ